MIINIGEVLFVNNKTTTKALGILKINDNDINHVGRMICSGFICMNHITSMYEVINGKGALDVRLVASVVEKGYNVHEVHTCVLMWIGHDKQFSP